MKQPSTISLLFSLLAVSPAFGQTQKLTGSLFVHFSDNNPSSGDSATMAYNSQLQLNERVNWKLDAAGNWNFKSRLMDHAYDLNGNILYYLLQVRDMNNDWIDSERHAYTYDGNGKELTYLIEKWDTTTNGWLNFQRKISTYNPEGKQLSYLEEKWNGTAWVNQQSPKYWEYDANGNRLSLTWGNYRVLYTYNAQNLVDTKIEQEKNGGWINKTRAQYTYLPNDTKIETETTYYWFNNLWNEDFRYSDNYDANEKLVQHLTERWSATNWVNSSLELHNYDANGYIMEDLLYNWVDTTWVNSSTNLYSYDADNNLVYWIWKQWESGTWENVFQQFNGFDANFNFISARMEYWDGSAWTLSLIGRNHYAEFVSTHTPTLADFDLFPNPASSTVTIKGESLSQAMIFDQYGRLVRLQSLHGQDQETIQVGNLPSGNYVLQVIENNGKVGAKPLQIRY